MGVDVCCHCMVDRLPWFHEIVKVIISMMSTFIVFTSQNRS